MEDDARLAVGLLRDESAASTVSTVQGYLVVSCFIRGAASHQSSQSHSHALWSKAQVMSKRRRALAAQDLYLHNNSDDTAESYCVHIVVFRLQVCFARRGDPL